VSEVQAEDVLVVAKAPQVEGGTVKSATRVLDLFEFLGRWDAEKTHAEIAEDLGIPKSSLTQLLKTLVNRGYLTYAPGSKGYQLGPSIAKLAKRVNDGNDMISTAEPLLTWLTRETEETCALNFIKGDKSEVVACVMSSHRLTYTMRRGDTAPLYATSGGKAILAFLPPEMIEEYCGRVSFEQITPNTINSVERLRQELQDIRLSGLAFVFEEFTPGIAGVAAPILSASGHPLGSINTAVPVARFTAEKRDQCISSVQKAVAMLRQQMRISGLAR